MLQILSSLAVGSGLLVVIGLLVWGILYALRPIPQKEPPFRPKKDPKAQYQCLHVNTIRRSRLVSNEVETTLRCKECDKILEIDYKEAKLI